MPYWRLSGFYFFYFATLGALVPYWGLYLQSVGFTARDIGNLMALLMISRIVAPNVWAWFADHRQNRMRVVRYSAFLTPVTFAGVLLGADFWWLALVMLLFSFFWHASLPLLEVLVMQHTGARPGAYGRVRLWGSLGFIAAVLALGPVIDARGPRLVPLVLLVLMLGIWLFSLTLPESEARGRVEHPTPFIRLILRPEIFAFLLACFLMQVSHGPYYTFYTIYLEGHGYSKALIGLLWALAVLCEIGVFLAMARILRHIGLREVLLASFLFAAARWLLIGFFPARSVHFGSRRPLAFRTTGSSSFDAVRSKPTHGFAPAAASGQESSGFPSLESLASAGCGRTRPTFALKAAFSSGFSNAFRKMSSWAMLWMSTYASCMIRSILSMV